jgi:hypothetical protein
MLLAFALVAATLGTALAGEPDPFAFELHESRSHRGVGVEGYVQNGLHWRITNVQVQVDSLDANGAVVSSSSGWMLGSVNAGGRGYFFVPVSSPAASYRASVRAFDRVTPEVGTPQAP